MREDKRITLLIERLDLMDSRLEHMEQMLVNITGTEEKLVHQGETIMVDFTAANAEIARETTIEGSIETLLTTLTDEVATISAASNDPATQKSLDQFVASVKANNDAAAAAVIKNTPAATA